MTDFEKTILWLADVYPNTQIKPKRDIADAFLRRFSGSSDIDKVIDAILDDESRYLQNGDTEIVLSFTMMVLTLYEQVSARQSYSSSDVIGYLEDMILINSELAQYFMNHSFKAESSLCDGGGYRSNFERLIVEGHFEQEDSRKKLRAVYERQKHYRFLKSKYSSDQVKTFLNVVFTAASSIGMSRSRYQKPKEVDWKERLLTITLRERIRVFNYAADGLALQQLMDAVHPKDKKQMLEAKCSLIWTLQNECGTASIEDLIELSDECLLDLAEAEIKSRENSTN